MKSILVSLLYLCLPCILNSALAAQDTVGAVVVMRGQSIPGISGQAMFYDLRGSPMMNSVGDIALTGSADDKEHGGFDGAWVGRQSDFRLQIYTGMPCEDIPSELGRDPKTGMRRPVIINEIGVVTPPNRNGYSLVSATLTKTERGRGEAIWEIGGTQPALLLRSGEHTVEVAGRSEQVWLGSLVPLVSTSNGTALVSAVVSMVIPVGDGTSSSATNTSPQKSGWSGSKALVRVDPAGQLAIIAAPSFPVNDGKGSQIVSLKISGSPGYVVAADEAGDLLFVAQIASAQGPARTALLHANRYGLRTVLAAGDPPLKAGLGVYGAFRITPNGRHFAAAVKNRQRSVLVGGRLESPQILGDSVGVPSRNSREGDIGKAHFGVSPLHFPDFRLHPDGAVDYAATLMLGAKVEQGVVHTVSNEASGAVRDFAPLNNMRSPNMLIADSLLMSSANGLLVTYGSASIEEQWLEHTIRLHDADGNWKLLATDGDDVALPGGLSVPIERVGLPRAIDDEGRTLFSAQVLGLSGARQNVWILGDSTARTWPQCDLVNLYPTVSASPLGLDPEDRIDLDAVSKIDITTSVIAADGVDTVVVRVISPQPGEITVTRPFVNNWSPDFHGGFYIPGESPRKLHAGVAVSLVPASGRSDAFIGVVGFQAPTQLPSPAGLSAMNSVDYWIEVELSGSDTQQFKWRRTLTLVRPPVLVVPDVRPGAPWATDEAFFMHTLRYSPLDVQLADAARIIGTGIDTTIATFCNPPKFRGPPRACRSIDVIGLGYGGLLARQGLASSNSAASKVRGLLTIGSAHQGSAVAGELVGLSTQGGTPLTDRLSMLSKLSAVKESVPAVWANAPTANVPSHAVAGAGGAIARGRATGLLVSSLPPTGLNPKALIDWLLASVTSDWWVETGGELASWLESTLGNAFGGDQHDLWVSVRSATAGLDPENMACQTFEWSNDAEPGIYSTLADEPRVRSHVYHMLRQPRDGPYWAARLGIPK